MKCCMRVNTVHIQRIRAESEEGCILLIKSPPLFQSVGYTSFVIHILLDVYNRMYAYITLH